MKIFSKEYFIDITRIFLQIQYMIRCSFIFFSTLKMQYKFITLFQKNNDIKISIFLWTNKIAKIWDNI